MYPLSSAYCSRMLSGSCPRKDANVVAGTASLQVREEEGGWNQPGSLEDVVSFPLRWIHYMYFCTIRTILHLHISSKRACERDQK